MIEMFRQGRFLDLTFSFLVFETYDRGLGSPWHEKYRRPSFPIEELGYSPPPLTYLFVDEDEKRQPIEEDGHEPNTEPH